ncbi:hypothetical protein [Bradyrhizobium sp. ARR65]|uniref:hypothetical protein n=1 Tax=Bradyrhizobium sp. ARR65 TaxID=1040989 RepID=UPI000A6F407A|nr:hypothetical protein [Bradyrhizobium sp. ARR65]
MRMAERLGAVAVAGLLAVMTPVRADGGGGRIALAHSHAAIGIGYPMQGYDEPRPGPYRDAAQFWKNYQFYYDECRRPPVRPELDWDYVLSCYFGY